ncbi:DUF84 family protein [Aliibacillus thermotolerans]|uniref:inosine/xanthosine triphosphatase n=1 Tax=Aliibacillus thermotolerans TaxID=1834418 RepID=A0ABW0U9C0_9BACI|nr:DUF84 family protein [Aliibacillus thermotolerans]MDA3129760.1 DUF84 family protein [Aliibacillus thermotolerans]
MKTIKVGIGSTNQAKIDAVTSVFSYPKYHVQSFSVPSSVSSQPFSEEETKRGAIHRAREVLEKGMSIGVGLEGGVVPMDDGLYVCNWGALKTVTGEEMTAGGAKIRLPKEIAVQLYEGEELGRVMERYTKKKGIRHKEGAIGVFTAGHVDRANLFQHIVQLLYGQYQFCGMDKEDRNK